MTLPEFAGAYSDGQTANRVDAALRLGADGIEVRLAQAGALVFWSYAGLVLISPPGTGHPVLLSHDDYDGARLLCHDETILAELSSRAPRLLRGSAFGRDTWRILGWCLGAAVIFSAVIWGINRSAESLIVRIPLAWEKPLGLAVIDNVGRGASHCQDVAGQAAVGKLMERLGRSGRLPADVAVVVLDDPRVNAFAAPGGQIAILRGLIDKAGSADEVAGILAHEIGHVIHRHPTQMLVRVMGSGVFLQMLTGQSNLPAALVMLSNSREAEAEADREAIALLRGAAVSTGGMAAFFDRVRQDHGRFNLDGTLLSDHPGSAERLEWFRAAQGNAPSESALDASEWSALRAICQTPPVNER